MMLTRCKSKQHQLLSLMLLVQLLIVALAGCSTAAAAFLSARSAALIQPSAAVIRQFTRLSSAQLPAISVDVCSELWAAESVSNSDAVS